MSKKPSTPSVYGRSFVLVQPLTNVECWNYSNDAVGNFQIGETINVLHAYDATHTTIQCVEKNGRPVCLDGKTMLWNGKSHHQSATPPYNTTDGDPVKGYRFIVPNTMLAAAIGEKMPAKTMDLVGDIMALEDGKGTQRQAKRVARALKGTSLGAKIKQRYVRS